MDYQTILIERAEPVLHVILNRPSKLNAMNEELISEMLHLFGELRMDSSIRYVTFTGAGRAFSSGADISGRGGETPSDRYEAYTNARLVQFQGHDFMRALENLEQITISAINGYALGAGLCIPIVSDFRIASEKAILGVPETGIGIFYTWGTTPRLTALIGPAWAKEMIITNEFYGAQKALSCGLVHKVVPHEKLMEAVQELVEKIELKGRLATRMTKKIINAAAAPNMGDLYVCEPELVERLYLSDEPFEGGRAFAEQRPPKFTGR
ncbi:MAG: enoyl-CoA hydratase/isomerase family protein [Deltaproteobacteria bacterium]|nr:enoyl-CoA hydratase/isomerase family protein [Deltaproteobacteria bacterium]